MMSQLEAPVREKPGLSLMPFSINHRHSSALRERLGAEAFATAAVVRRSTYLGELVDDGLNCLAMVPSDV
jgi:hypothetical protein